MAINFYDTSAILAQGSIPDYSYISHFVISELEEIKNSSYKDDSIKQKARTATRALIANTTIQIHDVDLRKVEKIRKKYNFLPDNMDGRIIAEAILLQKEKGVPVNFWTADFNMKLFSESCGFTVYFIGQEEKRNDELYTGWGKYYPNEEQMNSLYSNPQMNILGAKINEYCEIFSGNELCDILKWNGKEYTKLKYESYKTCLGEKISPRNLEQKFLMDMLADSSSTVKIALGKPGSGKSLLMLTYGLKLIQDGKFDKIVFVRNNIKAKDTEDIGYLKGTELEKTMPWLAPLIDHLGRDQFNSYIETGIIEPATLAFLRGRDIRHSLLYSMESQNLSESNMRLLLGRVGEGSQLWMDADLKQIDKAIFLKNNGIRTLINKLAGHPLVSVVKLQKTERSKTAELAEMLE